MKIDINKRLQKQINSIMCTEWNDNVYDLLN